MVLSGDASDTKEVPLPLLAAGKGFEGYWNFPSGLNAGNYSIDIYLDSNNTVDELNEANNWTHLGKIIF